MLKDKKIEEFLSSLGSKEPVPGGGGASALVGAIGVSLGKMVGNLTIGKKKYVEVQDEIEYVMAKLDKLEKKLVSCIDDDAKGFKPLARAYSLPENTEKEKYEKTQIMEKALKKAVEVPIEIVETCGNAINLFSLLAKKGSKLAISDAGVGVAFCKAAIEGAALNVFINTKLMQDREEAQQLNFKVMQYMKKNAELADNIYNEVLSELK